MAGETEGRRWDNRQFCTVVRDAEKTAAYYSALGMGELTVRDWTFSGSFRGEPSDMNLRMGVSAGGSVQMEIIEPRENAVFHASALSKRGEGGHHMGIFVSDLAAAMEGWARARVEPIQSGRNPKGTVEFAYMDTARVGGVFFEFIQSVPNWAPRFDEVPQSGMNLTRLKHVGIVVEDLEKTVDFYGSLGLGPFKVREIDAEALRVPGRTGKGSARLKMALSEDCRLPIELLQPLGSGTVFSEALERQGEGIHHVCCWVSSLARELARLEPLGVKPLVGDERFAYVDTDQVGGLMLELLER